jgi:hypothetical protein
MECGPLKDVVGTLKMQGQPSSACPPATSCNLFLWCVVCGRVCDIESHQKALVSVDLVLSPLGWTTLNMTQHGDALRASCAWDETAADFDDRISFRPVVRATLWRYDQCWRGWERYGYSPRLTTYADDKVLQLL